MRLQCFCCRCCLLYGSRSLGLDELSLLAFPTTTLIPSSCSSGLCRRAFLDELSLLALAWICRQIHTNIKPLIFCMVLVRWMCLLATYGVMSDWFKLDVCSPGLSAHSIRAQHSAIAALCTNLDVHVTAKCVEVILKQSREFRICCSWWSMVRGCCCVL